MPSIIRPMVPTPGRWGRHSGLPVAIEWRAFLPARARHCDSMTPILRRVLAPLLLLLFVSAGCTSGRRVTILDWQNSVIKYVKDEGDGRPSVLRDVTIRGGRRGFAVLGHPR